MSDTLSLRPLTPELLPDFMHFFDAVAFADNPRWQSCYCQFPHVDHGRVQWVDRSAAENRQAACERIGSAGMQGVLAYRDGAVVGWCNAAPRRLLAMFDDEPDPDADRLGQITCFVVAPAHRRTGVATALLDAACAGLKAQGLTIVEAQPRPDTEDAAANHHGPLAMFIAAGFQAHGPAEHGHLTVRRHLS